MSLGIALNLEDAVLIDTANEASDIYYFGFIENPGPIPATSTASFKILKVYKSSNVWIYKWAAGIQNRYIQIWDNRASLTYL